MAQGEHRGGQRHASEHSPAKAAEACITALRQQVEGSSSQIEAAKAAGELAHQLVAKDLKSAGDAAAAEQQKLLEDAQRHCQLVETRNREVVDQATAQIQRYEERLSTLSAQSERDTALARRAAQEVEEKRQKPVSVLAIIGSQDGLGHRAEKEEERQTDGGGHGAPEPGEHRDQESEVTQTEAETCHQTEDEQQP